MLSHGVSHCMTMLLSQFLLSPVHIQLCYYKMSIDNLCCCLMSHETSGDNITLQETIGH